jgi:hypothetical protein
MKYKELRIGLVFGKHWKTSGEVQWVLGMLKGREPLLGHRKIG